jgi:predicted small metal-binding protein
MSDKSSSQPNFSFTCPVEGCDFTTNSANEEEVFQAALEHAINDHNEPDTPEFRDRIRKLIRDEIPAV